MISMNQSRFRPLDHQRSEKSSARLLCLTCSVLIIGIFGCSKPSPEAPVLTYLREKAAEPLLTASNVTGSLMLDGKQYANGFVPEFKPQAKLKVTVDVNFMQPGITETAGFIKCVRTLNGNKFTGSSAGLNFPVQDAEFELPRGKGEWDLLILNSQNGLICSQRISVVE